MQFLLRSHDSVWIMVDSRLFHQPQVQQILHIGTELFLVHGISHSFQALCQEFYRGKTCLVLFQKPDCLYHHGEFQIFLVGFEIVGRQIAETMFQIDVNISVFVYNDFFYEYLNVRPGQTFLLQHFIQNIQCGLKAWFDCHSGDMGLLRQILQSFFNGRDTFHFFCL